jgi:hypothetical protein
MSQTSWSRTAFRTAAMIPSCSRGIAAPSWEWIGDACLSTAIIEVSREARRARNDRPAIAFIRTSARELADARKSLNKAHGRGTAPPRFIVLASTNAFRRHFLQNNPHITQRALKLSCDCANSSPSVWSVRPVHASCVTGSVARAERDGQFMAVAIFAPPRARRRLKPLRVSSTAREHIRRRA